jgi:hypothetical protein
VAKPDIHIQKSEGRPIEKINSECRLEAWKRLKGNIAENFPDTGIGK